MKIKKIAFSGFVITAFATPIIIHQYNIKNIANKNNIDLYHSSLPTLNNKAFLLVKTDIKGLALRVGYEDYYLKPNEISKPGKIVLQNGLELTWSKAINSWAPSNAFKIMGQPVKSFVNRIKISRIRSESSLLYVRALGKIKMLFIYKQKYLEDTLRLYLSTPNSSMRINWKVINGLVSPDNIKVLNALLKPGGYQIDKIKGSFINGIFTLGEFKLKNNN